MLVTPAVAVVVVLLVVVVVLVVEALLLLLLVVAWPVPVPCRRVSNVIFAPCGCTNVTNAKRRRRLFYYVGCLSGVTVEVCVGRSVCVGVGVYCVYRIVILQKSTLGGFGFDY